jgi:hypothetical protein
VIDCQVTGIGLQITAKGHVGSTRQGPGLGRDLNLDLDLIQDHVHNTENTRKVKRKVQGKKRKNIMKGSIKTEKTEAEAEAETKATDAPVESINVEIIGRDPRWIIPDPDQEIKIEKMKLFLPSEMKCIKIIL